MTAPLDVITPKKPRLKPKKPQHPPIPLRLMQFAFGTLGRVFPKWFAKVAFKFFTRPRKRAKHRISDAIMEQATISEILVGKNILKVYEWGSGEETVLMVHGWESRGTAMRSFVPQLLEAGYRVVAFDGPAHGDSSGSSTNLLTFAEGVKAIYHKYENVRAIIAHSFGGAVSAYAMYQLDRSIELERFVIIGTPSRISYPVMNALRTMNAPPMVRKYFIQNLEKISGIPIQDLAFPKIHKGLNIEKALVVHDRQDEQVNFEEAENTVKHWDKAELLVTDGFGHFALMKNPEVIHRVTEFIGR